MRNSDFDDFVKRQQRPGSRISWQKEKEEWIGHVAALYKQIQSYMQQYLSTGQARISYQGLSLEEENIGPYRIDALVLQVGRQRITFEPIGTLIIGAKGRVDARSPLGRAQILLVDRRATDPRSLIKVSVSIGKKLETPPPASSETPIEWTWKIVTPPPQIKFIGLTQDSFFELVTALSNG